MNEIKATVLSIQTYDILNIAHFSCQNLKLSMVSLELEDLKKGDKVILSVKPFSIAIGKNFTGLLSHLNQLQGKITHLTYGQLLTEIEVKVKEIQLYSIITTSLAKQMNLQKNDEVTCLIKESDLSISKRIS